MTSTPKHSSRIAGFYKLSLPERLRKLATQGELSQETISLLNQGGGLELDIADKMSENVIACHGLPLSLGLNFRINQNDYIIPMATEEPSVVAAASNAAKLVRVSGGFEGVADPSIMTAQVQLDNVKDIANAQSTIQETKALLIELGNQSIPRMFARGGGCRDIELRVLDVDAGICVVHIYVNVGDAMGANMVDTVAEAIAPRLANLLDGRIGLRILSNLPLRRMVTVKATIATDTIGYDLCEAITRASDFAELDPMRAVTHNKGIMNGIDATALALGQDWRAIEAGAHGYAAYEGKYKPLATWSLKSQGLLGVLTMPLAVGTVGGSTKTHPGVRAAFEILGVSSARELAIIMASVGLASNFAALKALAGEGIQRGHMRLHKRRQNTTLPSSPTSGKKNEHAS